MRRQREMYVWFGRQATAVVRADPRNSFTAAWIVENGDRMHEEDTDTAWMAQGNCRNYPPAVFFPSDGVGVDRARKICASCPVTDPCLDHALDNRIEHGVWGGCSERERRRILKRRRIAVSPV